MAYVICDTADKFNWSMVTPIVALVISIIALIINQRIAQRNRHLTIQQALFNTVFDKVKDRNTLWENEPANEKHNDSPHFKIMSELIISTEVIDKSLSLFEKNYRGIRKLESDYYYLFWKQLRTDLRGWIKETPRIAKTVNNEYYNLQIADLFKRFKPHFEKQI
jgi:hypothetical protein